jgi:shikimate kinase
LKTSDAKVIALGGGAWTIAANRDLIAAHNGVTIWLDAPFNACWERIAASGHRIRPLAPDRNSASELYQLRRASYELATFKVAMNGNENAMEVAAQIESRLAAP